MGTPSSKINRLKTPPDYLYQQYTTPADWETMRKLQIQYLRLKLEEQGAGEVQEPRFRPTSQ